MLDAKSAFDLADRLCSRLTYVEFEKCLMGPIADKCGVEQGGILSDRQYKLANNEQLKTTQQSELGIYIYGYPPLARLMIPFFSVTPSSISSISSTSQSSTVPSTM